MTESVNNAVTTFMAMQHQDTVNQKDAMLLRKVLDQNEQAVAGLIDSIGNNSVSALATSGTVGTQVNTTA